MDGQDEPRFIKYFRYGDVTGVHDRALKAVSTVPRVWFLHWRNSELGDGDRNGRWNDYSVEDCEDMISWVKRVLAVPLIRWYLDEYPDG